MNDTGVPSPIGPSPEQKRLLREIEPPVPVPHPLAEQLSEAIEQLSNPTMILQLDRLLVLVNEDHAKIHALEEKLEGLVLKFHEFQSEIRSILSKGTRDDGDDGDDGS